MTTVCPGVMLGSLEESYSDLEFTHVLNVASELDIGERVGRVYRKEGINDDDAVADITSIFTNSLAFIEEAVTSGGTVFVHCLEGKSRSVCVCLAYLVTRRGMSFVKALESVRSKRVIDVFPTYLEQTRDWVGGRAQPRVRHRTRCMDI